MSEKYNSITKAILDVYPRCEAIYLFGSHGTDYETPDSGIMKRVIESGMDDILEYTNILLQVDTAS